MKAYKVELLIIDHDDNGSEGIKSVLEHTRYPNHCINPEVMQITEKDIGEWDDDHPLNSTDTCEAEYKRIFG